MKFSNLIRFGTQLLNNFLNKGRRREVSLLKANNRINLGRSSIFEQSLVLFRFTEINLGPAKVMTRRQENPKLI